MSLINKCVNILEEKNMKKEINRIFRPVIDLILVEIYPYIYISFIFIIISFLLILGIFIILIRSNYTIKTNLL